MEDAALPPVPLADLLAVPIRSAARAQHLAALEAVEAWRHFALDQGKARMLTFRVDDRTETVDPSSPAGLRTLNQVLELAVPVAVLAPLPAVQLQELEVELGVRITELRSVRDNVSSPVEAVGEFTSLTDSTRTTMKVRMRIVQSRPEGRGRIEDLLADLVTSRARRGIGIAGIAGVRDKLGALRAAGVSTTDDLIRLTGTTEAREEFAKQLGVTTRRVSAWRRDAVRIQAEDESAEG